ncbi:MAG TPA: beta-ketoacyl synthase N-terminal-like domain-containing protein [Pyrinomonadaceae bacterium]
MSEQSAGPLEGVAIIGMVGRFPGAGDVEAFWRNLREGVESLTQLSDEDLAAAGVDRELVSKPGYVKAGFLLEGVELFDAAFFGFSPREAELLDPQQRLFLECAWAALEQVGYVSESFQRSIALFAGAGASSYLYKNLLSRPDLLRSAGSFQLAIGNEKDFLPTRVAHELGLRGPAVAVQTACSTSLVAVHLACQSLLSGESDLALAGGVSISLPQRSGYLYREGDVSSPDGHCRAFDERSSGAVRGSGVGVVVLKRLEDALADGDLIHAVIRGSAVNNDGADRVGYTAPGVAGQAAVIAEALGMAGLEPSSIQYVEAHGTGTPLGDPIEIAALNKAFRGGVPNTCALGSVKTNVGHLDAAAGVTGLIKTALALRHRFLPPSLNFERPNPRLDLASGPFFINATPRPWETQGAPRRAGVSSFGIGGTNAHVILEEAPPHEPSGPSREWQLLLLSARSPAALEAATDRLSAHLRGRPEQSLADTAYTLQVGRRRFRHRRVLLCRDAADAARALEARDPRRVLTGVGQLQKRRVAFMFPGLGDQHVNMALGLYQSEPKFREQFDLCCELLRPHLGVDLREVIYPAGVGRDADAAASTAPPQGLDLRKLLSPRSEQPDEHTRRLNQTALTQPAVFVVEYALAQLWLEWGVRPEAMIGYSVGEYVAACLSGVLSLEDALRLVAHRARLIDGLPAGAMLAVPLSEAETAALLGPELSIAAINGPSMCVVSGLPAAVEELAQALARRDIACRPLQTSHAFHSRTMNPIAEDFAGLFSSIKLHPPRIPYLSNVTGHWITEQEATDPGYWTRHLLQTVRFADGVRELWGEEGRVLLEVGPGQTLSSLVIQQTDFGSNKERVVLPSMRHAYDSQADTAFLSNTIGRLWLAGVEPDWSKFYAHERRRRTPLPTYPFERQRYWVDARPRGQAGGDVGSPTPAEHGRPVSERFYIPSWKLSLPPRRGRAEAAEAANNWLVLADAQGLGEKVLGRLEERGEQAVAVHAGREFARLGERAYTIDPQKLEDYSALAEELAARGQLPTRVIHLWGVTSADDADAAPASGIERFNVAQVGGFNSLVYLAQAIAEKQKEREIHVAVVTNGVHAVTGEERLRPEKATVLTPSMMIPRAMPRLTCRNIDVVLPEPGDPRGRTLPEQLIAECSPHSSGEVIAYRKGRRWARDYQPVQVEPDDDRPSMLRGGGVYLITGGLTGVGAHLAEYLARTVGARLALIEEADFPSPDEWAGWPQAGDGRDDGLGEKIKKLNSLRALGAEVEVLGADVASESEMRAAVARVYERFGALHGVAHTVETAGPTTADPAGGLEGAAPSHFKVRGAYALESALAGREVDFCLLVSSLAALLGQTGSMPQGAANIFSDAFAHAMQADATDTRWVSVTWDEEAYEEEAPEIWSHVFSLGAVTPQLVMSGRDLSTLLARADTGDARPGEEQPSAPASARPMHARPDIGVPYAPPESPTEIKVAEIWQELLGIEPVGIYDNFFQLGGNSLVGIQLATRLRDAFQVNIALTAVFEVSTVGELALAIEDLLLSEIEELDEVDAEQYSAEA